MAATLAPASRPANGWRWRDRASAQSPACDLGLVHGVAPSNICMISLTLIRLFSAGRDWHRLVEGLINRSCNERLQLLAWLALNAGKHTGNQPTRLAHLDDGNDHIILVQGDEGPAQVVRLGHQGTPSVGYSDDGAISSPPAPDHLSAGGSEIRTLGPSLTRGLHAVENVDVRSG